MDAASRLTWLHMHATSSRWQKTGLAAWIRRPLLSPTVNACLFSPGLIFQALFSLYLLAAGVKREEWLQPWPLRLASLISPKTAVMG